MNPDQDPNGQDAAAEHAARELERRLQMFLPPPLLADAHAFATAYVNWQRNNYWRHLKPPPKAITDARKQGTPPDAHATELNEVRTACANATARRTNATTSPNPQETP